MNHFENGAVEIGDYDAYSASKGTCTEDSKSKLFTLAPHTNNINQYPNLDPYMTPSEKLKAGLEISPVTLSINARTAVMNYVTGIISDKKCEDEGSNGGATNHAIIGVGWGTATCGDDNHECDYIIYRNSWGADWGEDGYGKIEMVKGKDTFGACGTYVTSNSPGPATTL